MSYVSCVVSTARPPTQPAPITVVTGATPFAPEIIQVALNTFIRCLRVPPGRWLLNGNISSSINPNLRPTVDGVYQCVGAVSGLPETEFAGENGRDFYFLIPGLSVKQINQYLITCTCTLYVQLISYIYVHVYMYL